MSLAALPFKLEFLSILTELLFELLDQATLIKHKVVIVGYNCGLSRRMVERSRRARPERLLGLLGLAFVVQY